MREKIIVSSEYIEKNELLPQIEEIGRKLKCEIRKVNLGMEQHDIQFVVDINEEEFYFVGISLNNKEEFDTTYAENIRGVQFNELMVVTHFNNSYSYLNKLLQEVMTLYPNLLVTDEGYEDYYSIEDINSKNVPGWLLE